MTDGRTGGVEVMTSDAKIKAVNTLESRLEMINKQVRYLHTWYSDAARDSDSGFMQRACPSVRLSVCLSSKYKNAIFSKTKQFRAMVSTDDL